MAENQERTNLPTRSASSALSSKKSAAASLRKRLSQKPSKADVTKILARLSAVYGPPQGGDGMAQVMVAEWQHAMDFLPVEALNAAVEQAIRTLKFWPKPSELIEAAIAHQLELREALSQTEMMAGERPALQITRGYGDDIEPPFAPTTDELKRVSEIVKSFKTKPEETITDRMDQWAPASQALTVGAALRSSCAARRARGEPTCDRTCARQRDSNICKFLEQRSAQ